MKKVRLNFIVAVLAIFTAPILIQAQKLERLVNIVESHTIIPVEYTKVDGTVLVSHDNGLSWQDKETGATVVGTQGYKLIYVRADGAMFETKDGGKTWEMHKKVKSEPTIQETPSVQQEAIQLLGVLPQPASDYTNIEFRLLTPEHVTLTIYDAQGNQVITLMDSDQNIGKYSVALETSKLQPGVYHYRLSAGEKSFTGKISVVR